VGVFAVRLHPEQVHRVDEADADVGGEVLTQNGRGRQGHLGGHVAAADHDDIWFHALVVACTLPNAQPLGAVLDGLVHAQVLQVVLRVADDDFDVVEAE
jgi:hypothetical protein